MKREYKYEDLTGQKFGLLIVVLRVPKTSEIREPVKWNCKCECGNMCVHSSTTLKRSKLREENLISCGCTRKKHKQIDLIGKRFGKLLVLSFEGYINKKKRWKCKCDCGNTKSIIGSALRSGTTQSCGCLRSETCSRQNHSKWKGYEEISGEYLSSLKRGAKKRDLLFEVDGEYLWNLYLSQEKKCALSGIDIGFEPNCKLANKRTASLDRTDNSKGYIKGNVQWTHKHLNMMKKAHSNDYFIELCKLVAKHNGD